MEVSNINGLYTFTTLNASVISGEFINMKLKQIVGYIDAVKVDGNLPELMRVTGFASPEDETYLVFEKNNKTRVLCKSWIAPASVIAGNSLSELKLTINSLLIDDKNAILNYLNSRNYAYIIG